MVNLVTSSLPYLASKLGNYPEVLIIRKSLAGESWEWEPKLWGPGDPGHAEIPCSFGAILGGSRSDLPGRGHLLTLVPTRNFQLGDSRCLF